MAFIRKKGNNFYVVENRREDGRVKQTIVACLGHYPSVPAAIQKYKEDVEEFIGFANQNRYTRASAHWQKRADRRTEQIAKLEALSVETPVQYEEFLKQALEQDAEEAALMSLFMPKPVVPK